MKRAFGLVMDAARGSLRGTDQSLQVLSGRAEFPLRVRNARRLFASFCARHVSCPQRATVDASCTGDSYDPELPALESMRYSLPVVPVATSMAPCGDESSRVTSPS